MRALVYDCSAGISGDMNLAALIDLGADRENLERELSKLHVHGEWKLECRRAQQHGIRGTRIDVLTEEEGHSGSSHAHHHRTMADIRTLIETSALSNTVKRTALSISPCWRRRRPAYTALLLKKYISMRWARWIPSSISRELPSAWKCSGWTPSSPDRWSWGLAP